MAAPRKPSPPRADKPRARPVSRPVPRLDRAARVGDLTFLRLPTGADRDEWVKLREASEPHLRPWDPTPPGADEAPPADILFANLLGTAATEHSRRFLICRLTDGLIVGQVSLNQIFRGPFQNAVAGYWIGAPFVRRGYMRDALKAALAYAFDDLRLHRVEANIIPANEPSIALVRNLGFRLEGLSVRYLRIDGDWRDHERWAITREEWSTITASSGTARARRPGPTASSPTAGSSARRGTRRPGAR